MLKQKEVLYFKTSSTSKLMKSIIFLFLFPFISYSQSFCFLDKKNGKPVSYVMAYLYNKNAIVKLKYSDENGKLNLEPNENYTNLVLECLGYESLYLKKEDVAEKIYLNPNFIELKEVEVTYQPSIILGNNFKKRSLDLMGLVKDKFELSFFIENTLKKPTLIKNFKFFYTKKTDNLTYVLRFKMYKKLENSDYSNELVEMPNNIFEIKEKKMKEAFYTIDLSDYNLILPTEGAFLSLEVINILDENNSEFINDSRQNKHLLYISSSEKYPKNHTMFNFKDQRIGVGKNENSLGWKKFINAKFVLEVYK